MSGVETVIRFWRIVTRLCFGFMFVVLIFSANLLHAHAYLNSLGSDGLHLLVDSSAFLTVAAIVSVLGISAIGASLLDIIVGFVDFTSVMLGARLRAVLKGGLKNPVLVVGSSISEIAMMYLSENRCFFDEDILLNNRSRLHLGVSVETIAEYSHEVQRFIENPNLKDVLADVAYHCSYSQDQATIDRLRAEASEPIAVVIIGLLLYSKLVSMHNFITATILVLMLVVSSIAVMSVRRRRVAAFVMHTFLSRYVVGPSESTETKPEPS